MTDNANEKMEPVTMNDGTVYYIPFSDSIMEEIGINLDAFNEDHRFNLMDYQKYVKDYYEQVYSYKKELNNMLNSNFMILRRKNLPLEMCHEMNMYLKYNLLKYYDKLIRKQYPDQFIKIALDKRYREDSYIYGSAGEKLKKDYIDPFEIKEFQKKYGFDIDPKKIEVNKASKNNAPKKPKLEESIKLPVIMPKKSKSRTSIKLPIITPKKTVVKKKPKRNIIDK